MNDVARSEIAPGPSASAAPDPIEASTIVRSCAVANAPAKPISALPAAISANAFAAFASFTFSPASLAL